MADFKTKEPFYNRDVVKTNQYFQENVLTNSCFQQKTVYEKITKQKYLNNSKGLQQAWNMAICHISE